MDAPDGFRRVAPRPLAEEDAARLSALFGAPWEALRPCLREGGFPAFLDTTGMPHAEFLDQYQIEKPPSGPVAISVREIYD